MLSVVTPLLRGIRESVNDAFSGISFRSFLFQLPEYSSGVIDEGYS
jgi:hypothetical protein